MISIVYTIYYRTGFVNYAVAMVSLHFTLVLAVICISARLGLGSVVDLSEKNWDELTKGKSIFVKFCVKTCSHCNAMVRAWDRLAQEFCMRSTCEVRVVVFIFLGISTDYITDDLFSPTRTITTTRTHC